MAAGRTQGSFVRGKLQSLQYKWYCTMGASVAVSWQRCDISPMQCLSSKWSLEGRPFVSGTAFVCRPTANLTFGMGRVPVLLLQRIHVCSGSLVAERTLAMSHGP